VRDREACTQTKDQINICWSTSPNPVANISSDLFNKTYSSLLSASPSATALPIKLADFEPSTSTTAEPATSSASGASTASTASTTNTSASNTPSSTSSASAAADASSSGLSGGAIGGIVGGVVGGLALVGLVAFLLWRRRRAAAHEHAPIASSPQSDKGTNPYEMSAYDTAAHPPTEAPVTTKYGYRDEAYAHEAPGAGTYASEVPGESRPVAYEMEGTAPAEMDGSRR
jgi:predicted lipid-binding transport protein (Tim44 family)